jgi:hypothetical protein
MELGCIFLCVQVKKRINGMGKKFEEQKRLFVKGVSLLSAGKQES